MQNNKKLVEKYTKLISDSDKMRIDKDKALENKRIELMNNPRKERSNTSSPRKIVKNPDAYKAPTVYNSDQSGDSDGETKIIQNNKKLVEKYTKLMSEGQISDLMNFAADINTNPLRLMGFGTSPDSSAQAQNGGGGFGGTQSGGGIIGGGSQSGGGGSREDRKRAIRDDQSVTDYRKMLNRASGIRDARLANIDARREFLKTPEGKAELKRQRDAENDRQRAANSPQGRQERVNRMRELAKSAEDMKTANAAEKAVIDADPIIQKQRREADARTQARWQAETGGMGDRPYVNPLSPEGRIAAQDAASGPNRPMDDQRDQFGPKNMETATADAKKDTARVKAELEAEMRAEDAKKNDPPKNVEPRSELPSKKPPSLARPGTPSRNPSRSQNNPSY